MGTPQKKSPVKKTKASKKKSRPFLRRSLKSVSTNQTGLDTDYSCKDTDEDITLFATVTGQVIAGDKNYSIDGGEWESVNDTAVIIGSNRGLKGKMLTLICSVSGTENKPCILSITIDGGVKKKIYDLSTTVGSSTVVDFFANIHFM